MSAGLREMGMGTKVVLGRMREVLPPLMQVQLSQRSKKQREGFQWRVEVESTKQSETFFSVQLA